jgi:3-oxoacyl-[acyl-carrier-protein] synthase-3
MRRSAVITGTGSAFPVRRVTNSSLAATVDTSDAWVRARLGIRERRVASPGSGESTTSLAVAAGRSALAAADVDPGSLDLIVVATATPDRRAPATACAVQAALGARPAAAFDLAAVCSGFLYGLGVVTAMIEAGRVQRALLIGADTFSTITDWTDRQCVFFGDGAGAAVLEAGRVDHGLLSIELYADGAGADGFTVPAGGPFVMDGGAVYSTAVSVLPDAIEGALAAAGVRPEDVDLVVPHQPSVRILEETAARTGIPFSRFVTTMDRYANTAGASVGVTLDHAVRTGRLHDGDIVVFAAVGSGWTWGAAVFRWSTTSPCSVDGSSRSGEMSRARNPAVVLP